MTPPVDTRAKGRAQAVAGLQASGGPYVVNWDSIARDNENFLVMGDPFHTYEDEVEKFLDDVSKLPPQEPSPGEE